MTSYRDSVIATMRTSPRMLILKRANAHKIRRNFKLYNSQALYAYILCLSKQNSQKM